VKAVLGGVVIAVLGSACLAGCGTSGGGEGASGGLSVTGDEKGGKIAGGVGGTHTSAAMQLVTAHCAKYGRKGVITRMDLPAEGGMMAFQCFEQKAKPGT
jgi:hypothetical protein